MKWLTGPWNLPIELQIDAASNDARILLHSQENVNSLMRAARELICEYDSNIWTLEPWGGHSKDFWQNNEYVRLKCMEEYFSTYFHFINFRGEMWLWFLLSRYLFTIILLVRLTVKRSPLYWVSFDSPEHMQVVFFTPCSWPHLWPHRGWTLRNVKQTLFSIFLCFKSLGYIFFSLTIFYSWCIRGWI